MAAYVDPRFRPTLWPGSMVPVPPLRPFVGVEVDGDWITWPIAPARGEPVCLPDDFYLRELIEVPTDDLNAAAELFRAFGCLFDLNRAELDLRDLSDEAVEELAALPEV